MDLRNQAPTVLLVCCYNREATTRMQIALSKDAVNNKTRGGGEKGKEKGKQARPSAEDFQAKFLCVVEQELIVAGRDGVVKKVDIRCLVHAWWRTAFGSRGWLFSKRPADVVHEGGCVECARVSRYWCRYADLGRHCTSLGNEVGVIDCRRVRRHDFNCLGAVARDYGSKSMRGGADYKAARWYALARVVLDVDCGASGPRQDVGNQR